MSMLVDLSNAGIAPKDIRTYDLNFEKHNSKQGPCGSPGLAPRGSERHVTRR